MTYVLCAVGIFVVVALLTFISGGVTDSEPVWPSKPRPEPESLRFLRAVSQHERPSVDFSSYAGYRYKAILSFPSVKVTLEYDRIRRRWELDVRDRQTCQSLYGYYETWSDAEPATRDFLLETYGLLETIEEMMRRDREKEREASRQTVAIKAKYLTAKTKPEPLEEL